MDAVQRVQESLKTLFNLLASTMLLSGPNPAHEAIVKLLESHKKTSIITTNYDGCMDEAILKAGVATRMGPTLSAPDDDKPELIKVHGSVTWTYCEACQDVREFNPLQFKDSVAKGLPLPVTGVCRKCRGLTQLLLVPPLSFKSLMFPSLICLWNTARVRIEEASLFLVVGYAFSEADTYISKVIPGSLGDNPAQCMVVVDTNRNLVPLLRRRFADTINNFDPERIIARCGDSDQELPRVVRELVGGG